MKIVDRGLAGPDDPIYKGGLVVSNVHIPPPAASQGAPASDRKDNAGMQPAEVFSVEYYDDTWDSGCYFTCINRDYIFAIRPDDPEPRWECINLNYARWDAAHQRIYRNFRADPISREQLPRSLPTPPCEIPQEVLNPPPPEPPEPIRLEEYPDLVEYLRRCDGQGTAALHLVLFEDTYESSLGDGEFHYPEIVFFDLESARNYSPEKSEWYKYHIRPGVVWLDGESIGCKVPGRLFDHFSIRDVLKLTTAAITRNAGQQNK